MVKEFLESYRDELISSKISLNEELDSTRTKIKENEKFIEVLNSENDAMFLDFTPRKVSIKNKEQIENTAKDLRNLYELRDELLSKIVVVDQKLLKLEKVLQGVETKAADSLEHKFEATSISDISDNFQKSSSFVRNENTEKNPTLHEQRDFAQNNTVQDVQQVSSENIEKSLEIQLSRSTFESIISKCERVSALIPINEKEAKTEINALIKTLKDKI